MHHPTDRITHTTAFVTPVVEHWLEREIAQWVILNEVLNLIKQQQKGKKQSNNVCVTFDFFRYATLSDDLF